MSFFIPRKLTQLEYFGAQPGEGEQDTKASAVDQYNQVRSLAFFVVNLGFSKEDYYHLTLTEREFILKAWEERELREHELIRNDVLNAVCNALRGKGQRFIELFSKPQKPADKLKAKQYIQIAEQSNQNDGDWIRKIYESNGLNKPKVRS